MSRDAGLLTIPGPELHKIGIEKAIEIVKERTGDGPAYPTFDIDFVDPAYAPGTGRLRKRADLLAMILFYLCVV